MKFYFEKKFSQLKVLRSHLESVPFVLCDEKRKNELIDLVKKIMSKNSLSDTDCFNDIKARIDKIVNSIYGTDSD